MKEVKAGLIGAMGIIGLLVYITTLFVSYLHTKIQAGNSK